MSVLSMRNWVAGNPYRFAFNIISLLMPSTPYLRIINIVSLLMPSAVYLQILKLFGFGAKGPIVGRIAARIMSWLGPIAPRSPYAWAQSAAMRGYGTGMFAAFTTAVVVVANVAMPFVRFVLGA